MHHAIAIGTQVVGTLKYPGKYKKDFFHERTHGESFVRGIPVQKEGLKE
jgi:hypothetical protein